MAQTVPTTVSWHVEPATWPADRTGTRWFDAATVVFMLGFLFHNADHIRRGVSSLTTEVLISGSFFAVVSLTAVALVVVRHRLAPPFAVLTGHLGALGVAATHLLPTRSSF